MGNAGEAARALAELGERERAWFWWCPDIETLLVHPLARDPRQEEIRAAIEGAERDADAREVAGVLSVEGDGRLALVSEALSAMDLEEIADWVAEHHADAPALARLRGASLRRVDEAGTVAEVFEDDALWAEVPAPEQPDSLRAAGEALRSMGGGERMWFWMTAAGPDGRAALRLAPVEGDPDGVRFGSQIRALRLQGAKGDGALQGVARRQGGDLSLTTTVAAKNWADIVAALLGQGGAAMRPLRRARLVFLKGGSVKKAIPLPPHRDLCETVERLQPKSRGHFWFTAALKEHGGAGLLLIREDRDALKAAVKAAGGGSGGALSARGRLRVGEDGAVEMQVAADGPAPEKIKAALLGWAKAESARWPALRALRGVTITARD